MLWHHYNKGFKWIINRCIIQTHSSGAYSLYHHTILLLWTVIIDHRQMLFEMIIKLFGHCIIYFLCKSTLSVKKKLKRSHLKRKQQSKNKDEKRTLQRIENNWSWFIFFQNRKWIYFNKKEALGTVQGFSWHPGDFSTSICSTLNEKSNKKCSTNTTKLLKKSINENGHF